MRDTFSSFLKAIKRGERHDNAYKIYANITQFIAKLVHDAGVVGRILRPLTVWDPSSSY